MSQSQNLEQATAAVEAALRAASRANEVAAFALEAARALHRTLNSATLRELNMKRAVAAANKATQAHVIATQKAEEATCEAVKLCNALPR